jgi:hypothetical protein
MQNKSKLDITKGFVLFNYQLHLQYIHPMEQLTYEFSVNYGGNY